MFGKEIVVGVSPDGRVSGMHRDEFDLKFLGNQKITRATDIRFDSKKQEWRIWPAAPGRKGKFYLSSAVGGFPTYNAARDFEVEWMNACLKQRTAPHTPEGEKIGRRLYSMWKRARQEA